VQRIQDRLGEQRLGRLLFPGGEQRRFDRRLFLAEHRPQIGEQTIDGRLPPRRFRFGEKRGQFFTGRNEADRVERSAPQECVIVDQFRRFDFCRGQFGVQEMIDVVRGATFIGATLLVWLSLHPFQDLSNMEIGEVSTGMFDVELGLRTRIQSLHQLLQSRFARNDDELLVHGYFPVLLINDLSRSGDTLSSPILRAFSAISWNASAIIAFGSVFFPPSIISFFQSRSRNGLRISVSV